MFDPFGDFHIAGYLRNVEGIKDPKKIKFQESIFFEANIEKAIGFLRKIKDEITYNHFLNVHQILFGELYPWAGQDRHMLGVGRLVGKGDADKFQFEASELCRQAVEWGLRMGNETQQMRLAPGKIMGAFAWGHPFLDGNGRTMLLVHCELCHRAGFSIKWTETKKAAYLEALTQELKTPGKHLDEYLRPFIAPAITKKNLLQQLIALPGLDGLDTAADDNIAYKADDQQAIASYLEMKQSRGESIENDFEPKKPAGAPKP